MENLIRPVSNVLTNVLISNVWSGLTYVYEYDFVIYLKVYDDHVLAVVVNNFLTDNHTLAVIVDNNNNANDNNNERLFHLTYLNANVGNLTTVVVLTNIVIYEYLVNDYYGLLNVFTVLMVVFILFDAYSTYGNLWVVVANLFLNVILDVGIVEIVISDECLFVIYHTV